MAKKKSSTEFIFKKVSIDLFHGGLMAKLGSHNLQTLLALATFMDKDGVCYPSQDLLAGADYFGVRRNKRCTVEPYQNIKRS